MRPTEIHQTHPSAARYVLWDATGWHKSYSSPAWQSQATAEQKRIGWEMAVRIEKILCTVLHEAHRRQVEEAMETLAEGPESESRAEQFYRMEGQE